MPLNDWIEEVNRTAAAFQRQIQEGLKNFLVACNGIREVMESPPESVRNVFSYLANRGWYLSIDSPVSPLFKLADMIEEGKHEEIEQILQGHTRSRLDKINQTIQRAWPHRAHILSQVIHAHNERLYAVSIPTILAQSDGICLEVLGVKFFSKKRKTSILLTREKIEMKLAKLQLPRGSIVDLLFEHLREASSVALDTNERDAKRKQNPLFGPLNRHGVIHGMDIDYPSEANSLRALCMLDYLASLKSFLEMHHKRIGP